LVELANSRGENPQIEKSCSEEPDDNYNDEQYRKPRLAGGETGERKKHKKKHQPSPAVSDQKAERHNEQTFRPAKFQHLNQYTKRRNLRERRWFRQEEAIALDEPGAESAGAKSTHVQSRAEQKIGNQSVEMHERAAIDHELCGELHDAET